MSPRVSTRLSSPVGFTRAFGTFGGQPAERSMGVKVGDALLLSGEPVEYEYDFGSTTTLKLSVMTERTGRPGRSAVRLLARNMPPVWPCAISGQPATWVCTYCLQEEGDAFASTTHREQHACSEQEGLCAGRELTADGRLRIHSSHLVEVGQRDTPPLVLCSTRETCD